MAGLEVCPICDSLVFSCNNDFSCCGCGTLFSHLREGGVVLNRVGAIMGKMVNGYHEVLSEIGKGHDTSGFLYNHL
ncbi:MAG: hypothetical protein ACXAB2_03035 [Candidatus Hodarchaeales archaeon]